MLRIYGTCVALSGLGVLLRGPSGSGKSDLALRLIDAGALLVADDQVLVEPGPGDAPVARAPADLKGFIEVRGIGILPVPVAETAPLALVVDLPPPETPAAAERLPESDIFLLLDRPMRRLSLDPFHASAVARLRLAARLLAEGR